MKKFIVVLIGSIMLIFIIKSLGNLSPSLNSPEISTEEKLEPKKEILGIDISHHNKIEDWNKVKNSIDFVYIKATEGKSFKDPKFQSNWDNAKKYGVRRGAYHFFVPNVSGKKQFENFKNSVKLLPGDLPPVLDVERKSGEYTKLDIDINEVNEWLRLAEEYYGVKPIIYSDYITFKFFMNNKVNKNKLWIYFPDGYMFEPSFSNYECSFWQYNQYGKIDGIDGDVDLDMFYGNTSEFEELLKK